jgi:hypothetical protein
MLGEGTNPVVGAVPGAIGTVLTSNGSSADPTFQTVGGTAGVASWNTRTGVVTMNSGDVTGALGFTPYNATNPAGYQTAAQVMAAVPVAASTPPLMNGAVAVGTGTTWARADHVHASDTSRLPLSGGTVTGTLTVNGNLTTGAALTVRGNANPTLDVVSGLTALFAPDATGTNGGIYIGTLASGGNTYFHNQVHTWQTASGAVTTMALDTTGNLTIYGATATKPGGGSWTAPSDLLLKDVIGAYDTGLAQVCALEPITYTYNGRIMPRDGKTYIGLDAASVRGIMPELVGSASWTPLDAEPIEFLTIDSGPLIYALVNSVKELAAKVAVLEERLAHA